jgi:hypothetical protein
MAMPSQIEPRGLLPAIQRGIKWVCARRSEAWAMAMQDFSQLKS